MQSIHATPFDDVISHELTTRRLRRLEFIGNASALEVLRLNNNGMGPQGGAMIAGALLENAKKAEREGRKSRLRVLVCGESVEAVSKPISVGDSCRRDD